MEDLCKPEGHLEVSLVHANSINFFLFLHCATPHNLGCSQRFAFPRRENGIRRGSVSSKGSWGVIWLRHVVRMTTERPLLHVTFHYEPETAAPAGHRYRYYADPPRYYNPEPRRSETGLSASAIVGLISAILTFAGSMVGLFVAFHKAEATALPQPTVIAREDPCSGAETHWTSAEKLRTISAYREHLREFGSCKFAGIARQAIAELERAKSPPPPQVQAPLTPEYQNTPRERRSFILSCRLRGCCPTPARRRSQPDQIGSECRLRPSQASALAWLK